MSELARGKRIPVHAHTDGNDGGRIGTTGPAASTPPAPSGSFAPISHTHGDPDIEELGHWEPVTNGDVGSPEIVFDDGDVVMEWVPG